MTYTRLSQRHKRPRATIDFETRSAANIRNGAWLYAKHATTRILCLAFTLPGQKKPSLWAPAMGGYPEFTDYPLDAHGVPYSIERLFDHIREGGIVEAHNANFEAMIWHHIAIKPAGADDNGATGLGAPPIRDSQWRCSAAKAAALALPRDLEGAGNAARIPEELRKDVAGGKTMLAYSKPRKARKGEPKHDADGKEIIYFKDYNREDFLAIYAYCQRDVQAEHALSDVLPDLDEREYQVWLADFRANRRGILIDVELVDAAIKLDAQLKQRMNDTLARITATDERPQGIKGTERAKLIEWLADRGVDLPDSTAPTLDHVMGTDAFKEYPDDVRQVIRIARNINRTSVSKYKRIRECMDPDDHRVRELVMYHGAATGRWSGKGIQVQNFPKGDLPGLLGLPADHPLAGMAFAVAAVKTGDLDWCTMLYGDVLSLLSGVLRGALIPSPGKVFYVADYAAIEARVVLWLAGAIQALEVFRRGEDIYMDMATGIYGYPVTDKKKQKAERAFGKVAVLGLGYGMGWLTFLLTLRSYGIKFTPEAALKIMGDRAEDYCDKVKAALWPQPPDEYKGSDPEKIAKYEDAVAKFKKRRTEASKNRRRLIDEREDPTAIVAELALCKFTVDAYRTRYPEVKKLWADQEKAACRAVLLWNRAKKAQADDIAALGFAVNEGPDGEPEPIPVVAGKITWVVETYAGLSRLYAILPSGRRIAYNYPEVVGIDTPWGEKRLSLRFMGVHKKTRKWARMASYGGSIVENVDQGTARDMMADATIRIDATEWDAFMFELLATIHDEALAEAEDDGIDHREEFEALMATLAAEYEGCPVAAEGDRLSRYQK